MRRAKHSPRGPVGCTAVRAAERLGLSVQDPSDGRRQILNFLLAGDFIGVQQKTGGASAHLVQALTDVVLCVFQRDAL